MSDSDSDCDSLDCGELRSRTQNIYGPDCPVLTLHPSEDTYKRWNNIPLSLRKKHVQLLKVCSFWLPMVLQRQRVNSTTRWAMHVGFIDSVDSDLNLNHLYRIEVLESVLRALDRGCVSLDQTRHLIWISNKLNLHVPEVLEDALQWLQRTGEPNICQQILDLGPKQICFVAIQYIFAEYAQFIQSMGVNVEGIVRAMTVYHTEADTRKSEEMKTRGNEYFQHKEYDAAIKCYTQAIRYTPENHMVYGNRALCYIRCQKYLKAVGDGKRATLLDPLWAKGHYRYCEALFYLKEHKRAIDANTLAQKICIQTSDGLKDLVQQHKKFFLEMTEKAGLPRETKNKRPGFISKISLATSLPPTATAAVKVDTKPAADKVPHVKVKKTNPGVKEGITPASNTKLHKQEKSEIDKSKKEGLNVTINKSKNEKDRSHEKNVPKSTKVSVTDLRSAVQDGYGALADLRCWLAEKAFSQALTMLQTTTLKDLGISTLDEALLHYGRASALIEIGQPQELGEARREFAIIKSFEKRTFQCLVYYGIGRVYFKENRFKDAVAHFTDSMQMVNKRITPGKLTWPLTKEIVKETQLDYFKELLFQAMDSCKFPPMPDAICRHGNCIGHIKRAIYFTDPDFKGFIRLVCCQGCVVEYHISCWKSFKATSFSDSSEKDFLRRDCFTPDCTGPICRIQIYGSTGLIKCKFETDIIKPEHPKKLRVNQKCTSLKKLQSKEERKRRRKQGRQASKDANITNNHSRPEEQDAARAAKQSRDVGPCTLPLHRDHVLFQIKHNRELLRGHRCHDLRALVAGLKPWVELDHAKGNAVAARFMDLDHLQVESLGQIVDLLLERRNRVWARVFINFLSSSLKWAQQLDSKGLTAASLFIETHAGHLEEMDLSSLLRFAPLQDVLVNKFESRPELLSQSGIAVTEYLKQAPAQDVRLFIWTLEEHRDQYDYCHTILDEFFEILDGDCLVIKKSDNVNENNSPVKTRNRGRKKKPRDQKPVIILSAMRGGTQRDEQDFFDDDEDALSLFHPSDPFSVPDHLRDQVACFESHYNPPNHRSILDNNPDPTEESLYDYFAQILEEHGPLDADDPLLVGQLDHFPAEAQRKIQQSGGFKLFLLQSLRFIMMGEHIGLTKHAVSLRDAGRSLDDLDVLAHQHIALPPAGDLPLHDDDYNQLVALPCPYPYFTAQQSSSKTASMDCISKEYGPHGTTGSDAVKNTNHVGHSSGGGFWDLNLPSSEVEESVSADIVSVKNTELRNAQAYRGDRCDVAINTENGWDLKKAAQTYKDLEKQIRNTVQDSGRKELQNIQAITSLEKEVEETEANIQVTNKEVELFQQKLEEMVRRDQKEKKANQEEIKALNMEIEELAGKQTGLSRSLQEKTAKYKKQLSDCCDLSNQSAAEKMRMEDEIKRYHDSCTEAAARSRAAELSILENMRRQSLYCLQKSLSDSREILLKLDEVALRYPAQVMAIFQHRWRSCIQEATEKILMVESQYQEQKEQLKKGTRLSSLPHVSAPCAPEPPVALTFSSIQKFSFGEVPQARYADLPSARGPAPDQHRANMQAQPCGPSLAQAPIHPPAIQRNRPLEPQQTTRFDRILEQLGSMFPDYNRQELMKFVHMLRRAKGGALTSMTFQEVINSVSQIILDHQEADDTAQPHLLGSRVRPQNSTSSTQEAPPPTSHVWMPLGPQKHCHTNALNMEDPCIICHEDMSPERVCVLQCRHTFHKECIRSWLKEQSTCPTCRKHALLSEDFPMLAGRWRSGPPAPSST